MVHSYIPVCTVVYFCMQEFVYELFNFLAGVIMCLSSGGSFPDVMQILELQLVMVVILSTFLLITTLSIFSNIMNIFLSEVCMQCLRTFSPPKMSVFFSKHYPESLFSY